jgi:hypothetical protein
MKQRAKTGLELAVFSNEVTNFFSYLPNYILMNLAFCYINLVTSSLAEFVLLDVQKLHSYILVLMKYLILAYNNFDEPIYCSYC